MSEGKKPGWRLYRTYGIYGSRSNPPVEEIEMGILPGTPDGKIWWQLSAKGGTGAGYTIKLLTEDLGFLEPEPTQPTIHRYFFQEDGGEPLEYVDAGTGRALVPGFDFYTNLLPHANAEDPDRPFFGVGSYLGHPIHAVKGGEDPVDRIPVVEKLLLDPHLTIGTGRNFCNAKEVRLYQPGEPIPPGRPEYEYRTFNADDYETLIGDVGMNIFTVAPEQLGYVKDRPVFYILRNLEGASLPGMLYRSNYRGVTMFMDEPAVIIRSISDAGTPADAANRLVEAIRRYARSGKKYGSGSLARSLENAGIDTGGLEILERFPVWETVTSAAWYEFKAGLNGFVHESRFKPGMFSRQVGETLSVDFPEEPAACIDFHYAWFRGAARHFDRPWGMAIYGQMELETAKMVFSRAYDSGAEYLWFWTSDHEHHVPFSEQVEHTRALRDYQAGHPRSSPGDLVKMAGTAIALPYGYLMDDWVMGEGAMWRNKENLGLEVKNPSGIPYRDVLAAAMGKVVDLLGSGEPFDLVYWGGGEDILGYRRVYRVNEDASVSECGSC